MVIIDSDAVNGHAAVVIVLYAAPIAGGTMVHPW